jgi:hypothetical protein
MDFQLNIEPPIKLKKNNDENDGSGEELQIKTCDSGDQSIDHDDINQNSNINDQQIGTGLSEVSNITIGTDVQNSENDKIEES